MLTSDLRFPGRRTHSVFCSFLICSAIAVLLLLGGTRAAASNAYWQADPSFSFSSDGSVAAFALQPDGRILVAGSWSHLNGVATSAPIALVRVLADGTTDPSFNATLPSGSLVSQIAVQPDGGVLVFGTFSENGVTTNIRRYHSNGTHDASFPAIQTGFNTAAIDSAGRFYVVTDSAENLVRYDADGALDSGFDTTTQNAIGDVALAPNGTVWVVRVGKLARLNANGATDSAFSEISLTNCLAIVALSDNTVATVEARSGPHGDFVRVQRFSTTGESLFLYQTPESNVAPGITAELRLLVAGALRDLLRATNNGDTTVSFYLREVTGRSMIGCATFGRLLLLGPPSYGERGPLENLVRTAVTGPSFNAAPAIISSTPSSGAYTLLPLNRRALFSIELSGLAPFTFSWTKDGVSLAGGSTNPLSYVITSSSDAGTFQLTASNSYGSVQSPAFTLTVDSTHSVPVITQAPQKNTTAIKGADVSFSVTASGTPAPSYQWYFNNSPISGATSSTLTLSNVQTAAAGQYRVVARNSFTNAGGSYNSSATAEATLTVYESAFAFWTATYFEASEQLDTAVSGPAADPDHDGLNNLIEYALGLDPRAASATEAPTTSTAGSDWVFTYRRPADRADITYTVERSSDLQTWTASGVAHELVSSTSGLETWRATYPQVNAPVCFFRLTVQR